MLFINNRGIRVKSTLFFRLHISLTPSTIHVFFSEAYFIENALQPSEEQDVQLQEFFWTGSGDGPSYSKPKDSSHSSKYPNTVIRTATILATVYIDGNNDFEVNSDGSMTSKIETEHIFINYLNLVGREWNNRVSR